MGYPLDPPGVKPREESRAFITPQRTILISCKVNLPQKGLALKRERCWYQAMAEKNSTVAESLGFRPLSNRVLVQREPPKEKVGTLWLPQQQAAESLKAVVLAVGPGELIAGERVPCAVAPGDVVMLAGGGMYVEVELDEQRCWLVRETDLVAILSR